MTTTHNRTEGLSPSEISQKLYNGTLALCPHRHLHPHEQDQILRGIMNTVGSYGEGHPIRTLSVLMLGETWEKVPFAAVQVNTCSTDKSHIDSTICHYLLCDQCPYQAECSQSGWDGWDAYGLSQEDIARNEESIHPFPEDDCIRIYT